MAEIDPNSVSEQACCDCQNRMSGGRFL